MLDLALASSMPSGPWVYGYYARLTVSGAGAARSRDRPGRLLRGWTPSTEGYVSRNNCSMLKKVSIPHRLLLALLLLSLALQVPGWLGGPSPDARGPLDWTGLIVRGLGFVVALSVALRGYARAHRGDYGDPAPDEASDAPRIRLLMT